MSFDSGDRVAWDHQYATQHASGSIILAEAVTAQAPTAQFGTVQGAANPEGTWWTVQIDGEEEPRVLTGDEIVKVSGDPTVEAVPEPAPEPDAVQ